MPLEWSLVGAVVEYTPCGRWASYGDVVRAAGLPSGYAKAFGAHLASVDLNAAWRVLDGEGRPSRRFHFGKSQGADDIADVIDWLKEEGVRFDHQGRARLHYRLDVNQLRRLPTNAARAHRLPGRLVDLTDLLGEPHPSHLSG